ncbi:conserved hypothetical protein [Pediculus humanus corporis]|uniref:PPPDE domain-containing protein n=1 Tax=Pediculus humanus subsp. corporis TaxID=121224 RepID=E0VTA3_PEDHC|nr:uncharacterized protein Phum_PHUM429740 [Pediculus humanus corporis]EEB16609.1 conserved hypothetical protein [Pediculus humanus corporis]
MGSPVKLYVYDLSGGLSKILSKSLLGRQLEGIWHTAIVVFEKEYFFGSDGVKSCRAGGTILQEPHEIIPLGETFVPYALFNEYLQGLKESRFAGSSYDLLKHNCNHFSDELAQFLCGTRIPKHILNLPDIIRETPVGSTLLHLIEGLGRGPNITADRRNSREDSPEFLQLNSAIEEIR